MAPPTGSVDEDVSAQVTVAAEDFITCALRAVIRLMVRVCEQVSL